VASIRVRVHNGERHISVRGELAPGDLRRLELACGSALEQRELHLELHVRELRGIDEAALRFLDGLVKRGAILK
jgi:hypothetical protein